MNAESIQILIAMGALVAAGVGLWHRVVITPMKEQLKLNDMSIRALEIDSAKLDSTLKALTVAIERLTDRLDR